MFATPKLHLKRKGVMSPVLFNASAFLFLPLLLVLALACPRPLPAADLTIKFSHVVATDTPKGQAALLFKRLVEEKSAGDIRVEVYPNAALYSDHEAIEALSLNVLQMAAPAFSKFTRFVPELQLFDLPFLFEGTAHLHRVLDGPVGKQLLENVAKRGLVGLGFWDNGFKQLTANRALLRPEDAAGLRFRIMNSKVLEAQFSALDARPEVLPFAEVYGALQHKTIDGQENTLSNIYSKKFYQVQPHLSLTDHGYLGYMVVTNRLFWDKLTSKQKIIIREAMEEATTFIRTRADELNQQALAAIEDSGQTRVHKLSHAERLAWREKLRAIYPLFYPDIGEQLVKGVLDAAK